MHLLAIGLGQANGQGWLQLGELGLAFVLSSLIGLEREWRQKSAGLRTHTLVGVGSALFLLVSKYGFFDVLGPHVSSTRRGWPPRSSPASASSAAG
jgi:putative Mg2+ transporter-C (MgtC) family protein